MKRHISSGAIFVLASFSPFPLSTDYPLANNHQQERKTMETNEPTKLNHEVTWKIPTWKIPNFKCDPSLLKEGVRSERTFPGSSPEGSEIERPEKGKIEFRSKGHFLPNGKPIWILKENGKKLAAVLSLEKYEDNVTRSRAGILQEVTFGIVSLWAEEEIVSWMGPIPSDIDSVFFIQNGDDLRLVFASKVHSDIGIYSLLRKKIKREKTMPATMRPPPALLKELATENYAEAYLFCLHDSFRHIQLPSFFSFGFFAGPGSDPSGKMKINGVFVENGNFRIEIENSKRGNIGKVWLDIEKLGVVKVEEILHPLCARLGLPI